MSKRNKQKCEKNVGMSEAEEINPDDCMKYRNAERLKLKKNM